jgi:hypothetical protein
MLYFGISNFRDAEGGAQGFLVFWCLAVVAIVGLNVWAAFSKNGSLATFMPVGSDGEEDEETGGRRLLRPDLAGPALLRPAGTPGGCVTVT